MTEAVQKKSAVQRRGFDAAVEAREHDYLHRWPFAREIYGIATTGPRDWSVRIGIYGEWGTGKTSVLRFVNLMARADGQFVIHFNPWQFTSTDELWRNFVANIFKPLDESQPGSTRRGMKRFFSRAATDAPKIIGFWKKEAAIAVETGLAYARRFLTFGPADLKQLREILGDRRMIVLIDDLDRTDPKLVPEMLFALKEIMDVPGMAFVCAFDPVVVGKVLGGFHPGFGDGLDFLEKIIDYPRWLPEPTVSELVNLAAADAAEYCPYVPRESLQDIVCLLPRNPRAVRQFVRLLRLLRPQIERHNADEIRWPVVLAANVIKVRFPRIALEIFENETFWQSVYGVSMFDTESDRDKKLKKVIDDEIEGVAAGRKLTDPEEIALNQAVWSIANTLQFWWGLPLEGLMYQFNLAERPCAVTWKEFDEFLATLGTKSISAKIVESWIRSHASRIDHTEDEVFDELVDATTRGRVRELGRAADATTDAKMRIHLEKAGLLLRLLSILILDLGNIPTKPRITFKQIKALLDSFAKYFSWRFADYAEAREGEENLLIEIASKWGDEILPLVDAVGIQDWDVRADVHGKEWGKLFQRLHQIISLKFASWIIRRFSGHLDFTSDLFAPGQTYRIRALLLAKDGPVWKDRRDEMFAVLDSASANEAARINAYNVLKMIEDLFRRQDPEAALAEALLRDTEITLRLWRATTSQILNPRIVGGLLKLLERLKQAGLRWDEPEWWIKTVADLDKWRGKPAQQPAT